MFETANSSFYQQETSIPEMKTIFDILHEAEGVYGARTSGAGFRGTVIGLIDPAYKKSIKAQIDAIYPIKYTEVKDKYEVGFCVTEDGARFIDVEELIMKAILLGAGYATRLYPLTKDKAKPLLEVAGKTITDHIVEKIVQVPEVDEVIFVTNDNFAHQFEEWVELATYDMKFTVVNDDTLFNATRLGAIGDIQFVIEQENITDDLLILAGDNLFEFSLKEFVNFVSEKSSVALAMYKEDILTQLQCSGVAEIDKNSKKMISFEEKPSTSKSNLSVSVFYLLNTQTLPLIKQYLSDALNPDAPENLYLTLSNIKMLTPMCLKGKDMISAH